MRPPKNSGYRNWPLKIEDECQQSRRIKFLMKVCVKPVQPDNNIPLRSILNKIKVAITLGIKLSCSCGTSKRKPSIKNTFPCKFFTQCRKIQKKDIRFKYRAKQLHIRLCTSCLISTLLRKEPSYWTRSAECLAFLRCIVIVSINAAATAQRWRQPCPIFSLFSWFPLKLSLLDDASLGNSRRAFCWVCETEGSWRICG